MADCDEAFHGTLFKCTGNSLLIDIGELLANSFRYYRHRTFEIEVHRMDAVNAHRKILEAIRMKDTDEAIFSMRQHLDTSYENALGIK
ncbi:MAG: FCD domain-containing protein [Erysipelotrichaceae bacterium]|nr:FCD domain-containing protein [Erysipelotrichaceae bacterium]